ncbi:MAG: aspartyl/glutamyl-tRNA(Asn/Gln) amidotransferase C subunit [Acidimicrobiales bacterium]|jgi:aspartyl/glutamyl-tRNA(Asn/Gln) amidotransferase C subunit
MKKEEILRLGSLARIRISDDEAMALGNDIDAVLEYVSVVNEITEEEGVTKKVGVVYNVFREDEVTVEPGSFTEALLAEAPSVRKERLEVKKILNTD